MSARTETLRVAKCSECRHFRLAHHSESYCMAIKGCRDVLEPDTVPDWCPLPDGSLVPAKGAK